MNTLAMAAMAAAGMGSLAGSAKPEQQTEVWPPHVHPLLGELSQHTAAASQLSFSIAMGGQASLQDRDIILTEISQIDRDEEEHGRTPATIARRAAADAKMSAWRKGQAAAQLQSSAIVARSFNLKEVSEACEKFTSPVAPGTRFEDARKKPPKGRDDEVVAEIRGKLVANVKREAAAKHSVSTLEEMLAKLDGKIRDKAEGVRAEIDLSGRDFKLVFPSRQVPVPDMAPIAAPNAVFCKFFPDLVRKEAEASLRGFYEGYGGLIMTTDERRVELRRLASERLELHRLECAVIWRHLQAGGTGLYFRKDTPPEAVLGVSKAS